MFSLLLKDLIYEFYLIKVHDSHLMNDDFKGSLEKFKDVKTYRGLTEKALLNIEDLYY